MPKWTCWMDDASIDRFRRELGLNQVNNHVEFPAEHDLPADHARQMAIDAFMMLARQENPDMDPEHIRRVAEELHVYCEPDATDTRDDIH